MILNHINHKMPIYKDCTFGEMMIVGTAAFMAMSTTLALLTRLLFGFAWIGIAIAILSLVHVTRLLLGRLQKLKYGKPYGYYWHYLMQRSQQTSWIKPFFNLAFVVHQGKWSVRRK